MRSEVTDDKVRAFIERVGRASRGAGRVYFTGGATAVLHGWRATTIDLDLKLDPEPPGLFEALPRLKDELDVNVELAAPDDFIPAIPDWRDRSAFIARAGAVEFYHYDYRGQALAKIERGPAQDLADVRAMLAAHLVTREELRRAFDAITPSLVRYPAIDADDFRAKLDAALAAGAAP